MGYKERLCAAIYVDVWLLFYWLVFLLFFSILAFQTLQADEKPTFTASAPDVVAVGDQFRLAFTVNTQKVKNFRAPGSISGFDILMGEEEQIRSYWNKIFMFFES